ncbi:MAG TPA: diguanylate cyclase [Acidimicrobiales bacterium]|nr:diguanylate cyclase [Acidimicrobiales bacterium]
MTDGSDRFALGDPEFHRHLTHESFDAFVLVGKDLVIRFANPQVTRLLGWAPEDLVGRSVAELLTEESLAFAASGLVEVDDVASAPQWVATPVQVDVNTPDSKLREIDVTARPVSHEAFDGYLVQLHPANAVRRYGAVTRAILDGHSEDEILPLLPPLLEGDIPGTRVAIGIGWTGTSFSRGVGDDEMLSLFDPPGADRAVLDHLVRSRGDAYALTDSLSRSTIDRARKMGFLACWGAPLITRHPIGGGSALVLWHWSDIEPGPIMTRRVNRLIDLARLVLDWADQQRRRAWEVTHDRLTDLLNRGEFIERLEASGGYGRAVLFCDLDDFKPVNDRYGHRIGDRVLQTVAERMQTVCGRHPVARLSGDEFAVLVDAVDDVDDAHRVAEAVRQALSEPIAIADREATVGVSIGVACDPNGALSADLLLDEADRMLRDCKSAGKNTVRSIVL